MKPRFWNRCDVCGKFISWGAFLTGRAQRLLLTPASQHTSEDWLTRCPKHVEPHEHIRLIPMPNSIGP